jgi:hypothetical protein
MEPTIKGIELLAVGPRMKSTIRGIGQEEQPTGKSPRI